MNNLKRHLHPMTSTALAVLALTMGACQPKQVPTTTLRIMVEAEDGDADVYVDGQYLGQAKSVSTPQHPGPKLGPGKHRVEVRKPGHFPVKKTVEVSDLPPDTTEVEAKLLSDPLK